MHSSGPRWDEIRIGDVRCCPRRLRELGVVDDVAGNLGVCLLIIYGLSAYGGKHSRATL